MSSFGDNWAKSQDEPVVTRLKESLKPQEPMRDKLDGTQRSIQGLLTRLEAKSNQLREKDSALFKNVVASIQKHDQERASTYSNELVEVRKISNNLTQVKLVMEQINLRLGTVQEFGDIVTTISPAVGVVKSLRRGIEGIMPEAGSELSEIGGMLSGLVTDAGTFGGFFLNVEPNSEDAEKILAEASTVAEHKMASKLPDLPSEGIGINFPQ
ncbi:MAG: hypothetical protein HYU02_01365 [Thaumarchaeota archaeon]|nr:hypothetical protein [Nitrososphaerota archaeon]